MKKYFFLILLVLFTVFLSQEFLTSQSNDFQIFAEKDYLLISSETGKIWGYGNLQSENAKTLKKHIVPYFSREKIRDIYSLEENKEYHDGNLILSKISRDLVHLNYKNQSFLFFAENFDNEDWQKLTLSKISGKTDWQVLNKNIVLDFLPHPNQGILYISDKNPAKKMQEKSRENNIPLISTKETGGFLLKFTDNLWLLKTRN